MGRLDDRPLVFAVIANHESGDFHDISTRHPCGDQSRVKIGVRLVHMDREVVTSDEVAF